MRAYVLRGSIVLMILALAGLMASAVLADSHEVNGQTGSNGSEDNGATGIAPLMMFEDLSPADGHSVLTRDDEAGTLSVRVHAAHLTEGNTYTYWWVVFNQPENCDGDCDEDDLFQDPENPEAGFREDHIQDVRIVVLGGNGETAGNGGTATFTGTLYQDSPVPHNVTIGRDGMFLDYDQMLEDVMGAEVHIILRDHGPAKSGAALAEQLWTFGGSCMGMDPQGDYECTEPQFAVHK